MQSGVEQIVADALADAPEDLTAKVQETIAEQLEAVPDTATAAEVREIVSKAIIETLPG